MPGGSPANADWDRLCQLMLIMARGLMRGRDRNQRESIDVVQSLARDLLKDPGGLLAMPPDEQRRFLQVALRHKLAALARRDFADKRGGDHRVVGLGEFETDPGVASGSGPGSLAIGREERELMKEALDQLDPETRTVLALHGAGVPAEVIAQELTSSNASARQRYVRAKRDLLILVRRNAGESAETIATDLDLDPAQIERRFATLSGTARDL